MINYLRQGLLIFGFTLLGEALHVLLPFPIPAAIYGLVLLFLFARGILRADGAVFSKLFTSNSSTKRK